MGFQGRLRDATGHQDGHVGVRRSRPDASRHFYPIHDGHHVVGDNQFGAHFRKHFNCAFTVGSTGHVEAVEFKQRRERVGCRFLVFDNQ